MANHEVKQLPYSYPMNGGDGPQSYSQNSCYQRGVIDAAKETINEAIISAKLDFKSNTFQIADFGCSVGPNTFIAVQNIIEAVELKYESENQLEFHVLFNDHANNDFNTLFKTLPPSRRYFAAGVPGTFHGRLFPKSSLHLAHISYALHWLSKVPKEIVDTKSPAWNKGSILCTGLVKEVAEAYAAQFKNDINTFLSARAQELVPGGLLVILGSTLPDGVLMSQSGMCITYDFFGSCLTDMAKLGLLSEEKVDSFNLPIYFPQTSELKELIEGNGCFSIERMQQFDHPMKNMPSPIIQFISSQLRAVFEGIISEHFGNGTADEVFEYFAKKFEKHPPEFGMDKLKNMELFILLKCHVN